MSLNLNGEVCGEVTAEQAASSASRFAHLLKWQATRRQASAPRSKSPSPSKRDGFAELRAAAARRKQQDGHSP
jgi:sRNA-binding protein